MATDLKTLIQDYYTELQQAFKTGKIRFEKLHLAEDVKVIGPNEKFEGRKNVEEMFSQFITLVSHFAIKRQYFDHESSCVVMDCVMKSPRVSIATIEWILVKNGRIAEIHPIYDTLAWQKALEEAQ